jgi:hypothetical protein
LLENFGVAGHIAWPTCDVLPDSVVVERGKQFTGVALRIGLRQFHAPPAQHNVARWRPWH